MTGLRKYIKKRKHLFIERLAMKNEKCSHEYEKNCDCSEDNNCGCTYPNNMHNDFMCSNIHIKENSSEVAGDNMAEENHREYKDIEETFICPACKTSQKDCACHKE